MDGQTRANLANDISALHPRVWRYCLVLTGHREVAEDLAQDTCARAIEKMHLFELGNPLDRWLMRIAYRLWLNQLRSNRARHSDAHVSLDKFDLQDQRPDTETSVFASELYTLVMDLPEEQRAAILLVYVEEYTYREAADQLDLPMGTLVSRVSAARERIAKAAGDSDVRSDAL